MKLLQFLVLIQAIVLVSAQESINPHEGIKVWMHALIAVVMSYGILTTCILGVNVIHKKWFMNTRAR
uniref:Uncharacterized protein n=1 Tax=Phragmatopoma lapidosa TaxID=341668 RepID=A0A0A0QXJ5_9ANNE|nr:hypothetical protein [Phragmatopoma lapidosa]